MEASKAIDPSTSSLLAKRSAPATSRDETASAAPLSFWPAAADARRPRSDARRSSLCMSTSASPARAAVGRGPFSPSNHHNIAGAAGADAETRLVKKQRPCTADDDGGDDVAMIDAPSEAEQRPPLKLRAFLARLVSGKWRDAFLGLTVELQLTPGCEPLQHVWYVSVLMLGADGKVYDLVTRCAIEPPARPCGAHACAWCVGCELVIAHGGAQPGLWCADPSTCTQPERRGERELRFLLPTHEQVTLGFYSQVARDDFESRFFGGGS